MISKLLLPVSGLAVVAGALATIAPRSASKAVPIAADAAPVVRAAKDANPAIAPGRVAWHPSFAAAQDAAKASGKPVLLFHMMGRLDRQFC